MTLQGERGCSNRQSTVIWERVNLAKSSYNLYSGWKGLIHSSSCSIFGICGGGGCLKPTYRGRGSKIAQKTPYDIWTFPYIGQKLVILLHFLAKNKVSQKWRTSLLDGPASSPKTSNWKGDKNEWKLQITYLSHCSTLKSTTKYYWTYRSYIPVFWELLSLILFQFSALQRILLSL